MNRRSVFLLIVSWQICGEPCADYSMASQPTTLTVGQGGGFNFTTVQGAISAAKNGDTVIVSPGTYTDPIDFLTKDIHLTSTDPTDASVRETTILAPPNPIDASTNGSLQGFRINGQIKFGYNNYPDVRSFSPHIKNNHIVTSTTAIDILVGYSQPAPVPIIENNVIEASLGIYTFVQAFGGGMDGIIRNNTFVGPGVGTPSAGILNRMHRELPVVSNNIITNFEYGYYLTYESRFDERLALFNYNNVFGNDINYWIDELQAEWDATSIQGNISVDPLFADPDSGDFRLASGSPMIDAGWDAGLLRDIDGTLRPFDIPSIDNNGSRAEFDIGAYEYVPEPSGSLLWLSGTVILSGIMQFRRLPRTAPRRGQQWSRKRCPERMTLPLTSKGLTRNQQNTSTRGTSHVFECIED